MSVLQKTINAVLIMIACWLCGEQVFLRVSLYKARRTQAALQRLSEGRQDVEELKEQCIALRDAK